MAGFIKSKCDKKPNYIGPFDSLMEMKAYKDEVDPNGYLYTIAAIVAPDSQILDTIKRRLKDAALSAGCECWVCEQIKDY